MLRPPQGGQTHSQGSGPSREPFSLVSDLKDLKPFFDGREEKLPLFVFFFLCWKAVVPLSLSLPLSLSPSLSLSLSLSLSPPLSLPPSLPDESLLSLGCAAGEN